MDAFPHDAAPRWLLRDRDAIDGEAFRRRVAGMGIEEVLSAPFSPWQNPYAERLIGSIRRDCLNHVVVFGAQHLRRVLTDYVAYYHGSRTHLSLAKDAPTPRRVQGVTEGDVMHFGKSAACTTVTNDAPHDVTSSAAAGTSQGSRRATERTPRRDARPASHRDQRGDHLPRRLRS